jgi:glycerol dehydrogenase
MKNDKMFMKAVFPGKYIQGEGAIAQLPEFAAMFGRKGFIIASRTANDRIIPRYPGAISESQFAAERFQGECCESEIGRLSGIATEKGSDVIIGMGGGKAIDTAKVVADRLRLPVIVAPTIASTDAPCSGLSIIYTEKGLFQSVYYLKMNPQAVIVDTAVIADAPARFLVSGMGDALATWFEARSCDRTHSANECGGYSTMTGLNLARLCYDTIMTYGLSARAACEKHVVTPALNHVVEANTLLSGIGFESSGLAAAHSIHNGLTALEETHSFYHGEKVAFGVLAGLQLTDASPGESEEVFSFCEEAGLPTTLADIGLANTGRDRLMKVAEKACAATEAIHHEAGAITAEKVLNAIIAADALGELRRSKRLIPVR